MLDGRVPIGQLLVRRADDITWHHITFIDGIDIRVVNKLASNPMLEHAELYYDLAIIPLATRPIILPARAARLPIHSGKQPSPLLLDFACSDSQWP
jgi:hypothetical protein